ncbi:hypothetical protein KIF24_10885 [Micromonospora sp. Llam7]|uniref:hypothetical protein n=1 Tax=Micromonospora tarapacensis TaxID=2835305 RepID=UPI001C82B127|nr:hypothetical protein [Micromonospora tarapacensis]MBX7266484.1 hypothetical protein [Micromonospora tarapacensis]
MSQFMGRQYLTALIGLMAEAVGKAAPVNDVIEQVSGHPAGPMPSGPRVTGPTSPADPGWQGRVRRPCHRVVIGHRPGAAVMLLTVVST